VAEWTRSRGAGETSVQIFEIVGPDGFEEDDTGVKE
jgi:hypothetical protein